MTNSDDKNFCVYVHINKINNKQYFGITGLKPIYRWGNSGKGYKNQKIFGEAIKKYGWNNFEHKILFEHLSECKAKEIEVQLIEKYNTTNRKFGYNYSIGGDYSTTGMYNLDSMSTKVYQYDISGKFIQEYPSMMEAERVTGIDNSNICSCCKGIHAFTKDFRWSYEHKEKLEPIDKQSLRFEKITKQQLKIVYQYDLDGNFLKQYESLNIASKETGIDFRSISGCCLGRGSQSHGFIWKYEYYSNLPPLNRDKIGRKRTKKVNQYTMNGEFLHMFESLSLAAKEVKIDIKAISSCCNNKIKQTHGFVFKFA